MADHHNDGVTTNIGAVIIGFYNLPAHLFICRWDLLLSFSFNVTKKAVAAIVNNNTAIIITINTKITFCISFRLFHQPTIAGLLSMFKGYR